MKSQNLEMILQSFCYETKMSERAMNVVDSKLLVTCILLDVFTVKRNI